MARFFLPPSPDGGAAAERAYRELRDQAEECTGWPRADRRIEEVECRRGA